MGKTTVAKNLHKRTTFIDRRGNIISQDGFNGETKAEMLKRKQEQRLKRLGRKPKKK